MKIKVVGLSGGKSKSIEVSSAVFGCQSNDRLTSQAVLSALANRRKPIAHSKTRGEVRGGGRKPWRQKGTGNARAGCPGRRFGAAAASLLDREIPGILAKVCRKKWLQKL